MLDIKCNWILDTWNAFVLYCMGQRPFQYLKTYQIVVEHLLCSIVITSTDN